MVAYLRHAKNGESAFFYRARHPYGMQDYIWVRERPVRTPSVSVIFACLMLSSGSTNEAKKTAVRRGLLTAVFQ